MKVPDTINYTHIFGPVPSRRLGVSLGVDVVPHKTCSLNCVYCECGRTNRLTIDTDHYVSSTTIKRELKHYLSKAPELDFITFSGSGEPTLYADIGDIIRFLKTDYPQYKVAVLTNGTLFYKSEVRQRILKADLVIASLDAASEEVFRLINRPCSSLNLTNIINGLVRFRHEFSNQYWIEVFIVPGINDTPDELEKIKFVLKRIRPDRIQINTLDRPGTESWVEPVTGEKKVFIAEYLEGAETITGSSVRSGKKTELSESYDRIRATIRRRPCTADDLSTSLGISLQEVRCLLEKMIREGIVARKQMHRGIFYTLIQGR